MKHRRGIMTALAVLVFAAIPQLSAAQTQTITCSSRSNAREYCRVDTSNGVRLSRQISSASCDQGSTWGYDSNGIWVSQGCRGEFTVGQDYNNSAGSYAPAQTVHCSSTSRSATKKYCAADTSGTVTLQRRTSRYACTQDSTWGYDSDGIWVSRGCGGDFTLQAGNNNSANSASGVNNGSYGSNNPNSSYAQTLRCESNTDNGRKYCPADTRNGVRLLRQISTAACDRNSTWGYDSNGVWVSNGCRADFDLNANSYGSRRGSRDGYGQDYTTTRTIRCESTRDSNNNGRQYCPVDARGGVHMLRQLGDLACRQGSSWGYDNNGIWVSNGCRAEFEVDGTRRTATGTNTTIPSGTELSIRTDEPIDSKTASVGQRFTAEIAAEVADSSGNVVIPRGSQAELIIRNANGRGSTKNSDLVIDLDSLTVNGTRYVVSTDDVTQKGGTGIGANKKTGIYIGGGAALGALIGAIAGGGKGAAIGAGVGAAAGAGGVILTKGKEVNVPVETVLKFRLDQDLRLQGVR